MRTTALLAIAAIMVLPVALRAGGPLYVAGVSEFQNGAAGTPLTWPAGNVTYYTDQGDLSPQLPQAAANAFVADAFTRWTAIPTVALAVSRAGQLDEDVNGSNVTLVNGTVVMPADIQPTATDKPVAIVYDADGSVLNTLLGPGAGDPSFCGVNSVISRADAFTAEAHFAHALIIINGNCAQTSADLPVLKYKLVRILGRVLGLGWSQVNDNVYTGSNPGSDDLAGFALMHPLEPDCSGAITNCIPNADQPRMDDRAALSRIYPVTSANLPLFPGKQVFASSTARVRGAIYFDSGGGVAGLPMEGVNVVARWIDPITGARSRQYAASSVSGFLFRGDAGNPVTGDLDNDGNRMDRFGSADPALEGYFDLAGLELPGGATQGSYEITVEAVKAAYWGLSVAGPYVPGQVTPSGTAQPVVVNVSAGSDVTQDIVMAGSARRQPALRSSFLQPAEMPGAGDWTAQLNLVGQTDYLRLAASANTTITVDVTALDEAGRPTQQKMQPVAGIWPWGAPPGSSPSASEMFFTSGTLGLTRLSAIFNISGYYTLGITDYRGDGRPDYLYAARVLYARSVTPDHVNPLGGDVVTIRGAGFRSDTQVTIGGVKANVIRAGADTMAVATPPANEGSVTIEVSDPNTGATSDIIGGLSFGAGANDSIVLLPVVVPRIPVGGQTPSPIQVQVLTPDGRPVQYAQVTFSTPKGAATFSLCGQYVCVIGTDQQGIASTTVTVLSSPPTGIPISAWLSNGSHVVMTIVGYSTKLDMSALSPDSNVAAGSTMTLPLRVRVLSNGSPAAGQAVNFQVILGSATLSAGSAVTDGTGQASVNLSFVNISSEIDVVASPPDNSAWVTFHIYSTPAGVLRIQKVGGDKQTVTAGGAFRPVSVRVVDNSNPPHPVLATVTFQVVAFSPQATQPSVIVIGDSVLINAGGAVALSSYQATVATDATGIAGITPSSTTPEDADVVVLASVGNAWQQFNLRQFSGEGPPARRSRRPVGRRLFSTD